MSEKLLVFSWNVRGLNASAQREAIHVMIQLVSPKLVCFQQTKLSLFTTQLAAKVLGQHFEDFSFLPANGARGGSYLGGTLRSYRQQIW
jgi:exonuclease III